MKALITGASKGIGKSIAEKLAKNGYDLVLLARNKSDLDKLKEELLMFGNAVSIYQLDCSNQKDIKEFFKVAEKDVNDLNVLVNNVGVFLTGSIFEESDEDFIYQQQTNVNAAYFFSKFFGAKMAPVNSGHIFNICSIASKYPKVDAASYGVTKAAMLSLNSALREELAKSLVKVTAFLPGATLTSSWEDTTIPKDKFVQPEDIADLLFAVLNLSAGANVDEIKITPLLFDNG